MVLLRDMGLVHCGVYTTGLTDPSHKFHNAPCHNAPFCNWNVDFQDEILTAIFHVKESNYDWMNDTWLLNWHVMEGTTPHSWPWTWISMVKSWNICISGMGWDGMWVGGFSEMVVTFNHVGQLVVAIKRSCVITNCGQHPFSLKTFQLWHSSFSVWWLSCLLWKLHLIQVMAWCHQATSHYLCSWPSYALSLQESLTLPVPSHQMIIQVSISCVKFVQAISNFDAQTLNKFFRTEIFKMILQETLNSPGFEWRKWDSRRSIWPKQLRGVEIQERQYF